MDQENNGNLSTGHLHVDSVLWLPVVTLLFASLLPHCCRTWGIFTQIKCVGGFKVQKLLHWSNLTLWAKGVKVQWHNEMLQLVTSRAAVDGQVLFLALLCPMHSKVHCWDCLPAHWIYCWLYMPRLPNPVFSWWNEQISSLPRVISHQLPVPGFGQPVKAIAQDVAAAHATASWGHRCELSARWGPRAGEQLWKGFNNYIIYTHYCTFEWQQMHEINLWTWDERRIRKPHPNKNFSNLHRW